MLIMSLLCAGMGTVSAQSLEDELLPEAEVGEALPEEEMTEVEKALRDTIHERGRELVDLPYVGTSYQISIVKATSECGMSGSFFLQLRFKILHELLQTLLSVKFMLCQT